MKHEDELFKVLVDIARVPKSHILSEFDRYPWNPRNRQEDFEMEQLKRLRAMQWEDER